MAEKPDNVAEFEKVLVASLQSTDSDNFSNMKLLKIANEGLHSGLTKEKWQAGHRDAFYRAIAKVFTGRELSNSLKKANKADRVEMGNRLLIALMPEKLDNHNMEGLIKGFKNRIYDPNLIKDVEVELPKVVDKMKETNELLYNHIKKYLHSASAGASEEKEDEKAEPKAEPKAETKPTA